MDMRGSRGFTLPEVLIAVAILAATVGITAQIFLSGQNTWFTSDAKIRMQENLRKTLYRVAAELRQSKSTQQNIFNGTGPNSSDSIRFSIPVVCQSGGAYLDTSGNVANWGAPLKWGCSSYTCMDADASCSTVEYKYIEYRINSSKRLIREVLDENLVVKQTDTMADDITDLQISISGNVVTLTATATVTAANKRTLTASASLQVYLRN